MIPILAFDPAKGLSSAAGWALLTERGGLLAAGLGRASKRSAVPYEIQVAEDVVTAVLAAGFKAVTLVQEWPEIYSQRGGRRSGPQPNDLLSLASVNGAVVTALHAAGVEIVELCRPLPKEWKGQAKKDAHNRAVERLYTESEQELTASIKPASLRHNATDAIGIGFWYARRWASGRKTPGSVPAR